MQRNWELIREILIRVETLSTVKDVVRPTEFEGYDEEKWTQKIGQTLKCIFC